MLPTTTPAAHAGLLHTREDFEFIADAPVDVAWPLFGAQRERAWAPGWDPVFLWPEEPIDRQGSVFEVAHGDRNAIWLTTAFAPAAKDRVQYVYVVPDVVATVITLKLTPHGASTHVAVTYERTSLTLAAYRARHGGARPGVRPGMGPADQRLLESAERVAALDRDQFAALPRCAFLVDYVTNIC